MTEKLEQGQTELMEKYRSYVKRVTDDLNSCRKIGVYYFREIMNGVYRIYNSGVHMELIVGNEKALLFDTGYGFGDLCRAVRQITELPLYVVNSHGHLDHACGNYRFDQEIYIHPRDFEVCERHGAEQMRRAGIISAKGNMQMFPQIEVFPVSFEEEEYVKQGCGRLSAVEEGHVFDLGGRTLQVVELPGHTHGSIGLLCPEERLLYVGDAINSGLWLFLPESTPLSVYRETLKKAQGLDFDRIVMSHDFKIRGKEVLEDYVDVAENLDFEKGVPFDAAFFAGDEEVRQCMRPGQTPADAMSPGFASVVITRKLSES